MPRRAVGSSGITPVGTDDGDRGRSRAGGGEEMGGEIGGRNAVLIEGERPRVAGGVESGERLIKGAADAGVVGVGDEFGTGG